MRLDALQAAFLDIKIKYIEEIISKRRQNANLYNSLLNKNIIRPCEQKGDLFKCLSYIHNSN